MMKVIVGLLNGQMDIEKEPAMKKLKSNVVQGIFKKRNSKSGFPSVICIETYHVSL